MSLRDKTAVVTGGSRGLGLGLVEALVAHGARVTVVARERRGARKRCAHRLGVSHDRRRCDGRSRGTVASLPRSGPDILALNAARDAAEWAGWTS